MGKIGNVYMVLVTFIAGVLITYIVCDKFLMKKEEVSVTPPPSETQITKPDDNVEVNKTESVKNSYQLYAENMKKERAKFDDYNNSTMRFYNPMIEIPSYDVSLKSNGDLYFKGQKIVDRVLNYFVIAEGNGGFQTLYFIYEDGKVGSANVEENLLNHVELVITSDLGYSDIVTILGGTFGKENSPGTMGPIFVDIQGHMFHE